MTRRAVFRQLARDATRPLDEFDSARPTWAAHPRARELFVWFEDTSGQQHGGVRGIAGLPECLLPVDKNLRIIERHYMRDHLHLLTAVRLRCRERTAESIAALYTAALAVGTAAWIGTGTQYELAWKALYCAADSAAGGD